MVEVLLLTSLVLLQKSNRGKRKFKFIPTEGISINLY